MKKYIVLIGLVLLSLSVQAKQKGFMETLNAGKKQEQVSMEEIQIRKRMQMEHMKERYNKKYAELSKEELSSKKEKLEHKIKFVRNDRKAILQMEIDVINSLLKK